MARVELCWYARCGSCRDAAKALAQLGATVAKRDLFTERLSVDELAGLFARVGKSPCEMLSTRSGPCRHMALANRTLTESDVLELMAEYPAFVRRPIIVAGTRGIIGFDRAAIERLVAAAEGGDSGDA
jgi:arsenate reductase-like glutaredoxin family protein